MEKEVFQKKLKQFLIQMAGKECTKSDVEAFFQKESLDEQQLSMILEYVSQSKEERTLSREDQEYLNTYLDGLAQIKEEPGERERLFSLLAFGDEQARERLTLLYLEETAREAVSYYNGALSLEDLIQEGNMGLTIGLSMAAGSENPQKVMKESIHRELQRAVDESEDAKTSNRKMVGKVRQLDESLTKLEKELGRKVYLEELAADMGITESEVRDIIKLTGEDTEDGEEIQEQED